MKIKNITLMGVLIALAIALSSLEMLFTPVLPLGVHIGLANIVVMFALIKLNAKSSFLIVIFKSLFVLLVRGVTAFFMSFGGGILSIIIIIILYKKCKPSLLLLSILGAIAHNIGQLLVATFVTQNTATLYYGFILVGAGLVSGIFTGIVLSAVFKVLNSFNINSISK